MYRKGQAGRQVGIADAAVERFFYGDQTEPELDEAITRLEHEYVPLLNDLRGREYGEAVQSEVIPEMVAHLCVRTRHIRQYAARMFSEMTKQILEILSREGVAARLVADAIRRPGAYRNRFEAAAFDAGGTEGLVTIRSRKGRALIEAHLRDDPEFNAKNKEFFDQLHEVVRDRLHDAIRNGSNDAMRKNVRMPRRAEAYRKLKWHIAVMESPVLLGDTVTVVETAGKRRFKPLDDRADDIHRLYLPISSNRVLIGSHGSECPRIQPVELNRIVVRCSYEYCLSSIRLEQGCPSIEELGMWAGLLSDNESEKIIREVVKSINRPLGRSH